MKQPKPKLLTFTILSAAENWGVSRETVRRGLASVGNTKTSGFTVQEINEAVYGDDKVARTRKLNLEADLLEIEKAKAEGRLLEPEIVNDREAKCMGVIAEYMRSAEVELPGLTNPTDPEFARQAVTKWVAKFWPLVRNHLNDDAKQNETSAAS